MADDGAAGDRALEVVKAAAERLDRFGHVFVVDAKVGVVVRLRCKVLAVARRLAEVGQHDLLEGLQFCSLSLTCRFAVGQVALEDAEAVGLEDELAEVAEDPHERIGEVEGGRPRNRREVADEKTGAQEVERVRHRQQADQATGLAVGESRIVEGVLGYYVQRERAGDREEQLLLDQELLRIVSGDSGLPQHVVADDEEAVLSDLDDRGIEDHVPSIVGRLVDVEAAEASHQDVRDRREENQQGRLAQQKCLVNLIYDETPGLVAEYRPKSVVETVERHFPVGVDEQRPVHVDQVDRYSRHEVERLQESP